MFYSITDREMLGPTEIHQDTSLIFLFFSRVDIQDTAILSVNGNVARGPINCCVSAL